jgi:hypothetical protein
MKALMHLSFFLVLLFSAKTTMGQQDTVVYTGINGKLTAGNKADDRKEIIYHSPSRIEIHTSKWSGKKWVATLDEKVTKVAPNSFQIRNMAEEKDKAFIRNYIRQQDGSYLFSEYKGQKLVRNGRTLLQFPLILDGESTEYYDNGQMKSRSFFKNNELVNDWNWLKNGENYIDSIFYSVDQEPTLFGRDVKLHQHVLQTFKDTGLDFSSVTGNLLLGFVVMETGEIAGIRVLKGLSPQIDGIAVKALQTLNGIWKPARLNGRIVRYFQLFPINFIRKESTFSYMEFNGAIIFYDAETK